MSCALLWLRRDLRLDDQPALDAARNHGRVVAVYIDDPDADGEWHEGGASRWWLDRSLEQLAKRLRHLDIAFKRLSGNSSQLLIKECLHHQANVIYATSRIEPGQRRLEQQLIRQLSRQSIELHLAPPGLIIHPEKLSNQQGQPYRVFTPFWRQLQQQIDPLLRTNPPPLPSLSPIGADGRGWSNRWQQRLADHWQPGEQGAWQRIGEITSNSTIDNYPVARDRPDQDGTSRLSPHIHFGEISIRRLVELVRPLDSNPSTRAGAAALLRQLGWREFACHLLWHYPHTIERPFNPRFDNSTIWGSNQEHLHAWQQGRTGIGLVDAGMRQLRESGWMHNRLRMVCASLLTKNLSIHWLDGARWFHDNLVDADLACNILGWQWVAGCGVDAAPYHRIFNPERQAERFDPQQAYRNRWLSGERPLPIIDTASTRREALARFRQLRAGE
jgi:deoxyribodipyrimidine photo-lyase